MKENLTCQSLRVTWHQGIESNVIDLAIISVRGTQGLLIKNLSAYHWHFNYHGDAAVIYRIFNIRLRMKEYHSNHYDLNPNTNERPPCPIQAEFGRLFKRKNSLHSPHHVLKS